MSLVTRAIIKSDWLNIANGDTTSDALIDRLIAAVDAEITNICGQPLEATSQTLYIGPEGGFIFRLPYTVPVTLTSAAYRSAPSDAWATILGCSIFNARSLVYVHNPSGWVEPYNRIVVTAGYTTVPSDVQVCAAEMVTELYNETPFAANGSTFGVASVSEAAGGQTITRQLLAMRPKVVTRLMPYMVVSI